MQYCWDYCYIVRNVYNLRVPTLSSVLEYLFNITVRNNSTRKYKVVIDCYNLQLDYVQRNSESVHIIGMRQSHMCNNLSQLKL